MEDTITTKEICDFLDKSLNFERKELEEELYGKKYHDIRMFIDEDGRVFERSFTIFLNSGTTTDFFVGGINLDRYGNIEYIQLDMCFISKTNIKKNLYLGTDIRKELNDRFLGKKLLYENK